MPSFVCDQCQETVKKPKLDAHLRFCHSATFSCIDCYKSFRGTEYRMHFSCITEAEKYEKKKTDGAASLAKAAPKQAQSADLDKKGRLVAGVPESASKQAIRQIVESKGALDLPTLRKLICKDNKKMSKKEFKDKILRYIEISLDDKQEPILRLKL